MQYKTFWQKVQRYFYNILCVTDCAINVIFGGGDYRETCSSNLGRHYNTSKAAKFIADIVNWIALHIFGQKDHCRVSIQPDCDHTAAILD